uniref:EF-hand domain-containing protein n=1 Tax=Zooxanthella nutricula TaxID=1333877 RepID=A0A7S2K174_9DINO
MLTGEPLLPEVPPEVLRREIRSRSMLRDTLQSAAQRFGFSAAAQELLTSMLQHDRHARPTVREALNHSFNLASYEKERMPLFKEALKMRERLVDSCRAVMQEPILKRVARLAMAHSCDICVEELATERLVFRMLDRHGYGELSISVWENDFLFRGVSVPEDLDAIFESMDLNRDGYISYVAFLAFMLPFTLRSNENLCKVAFSILDRGKDGYIDCADLAVVFGHNEDSEMCRRILQEVSEEVCGRLSWRSFVQLMGGEFLS